MEPETRLSATLLDRASVKGREYSWPLEDIPNVIEDARKARLASIGGQLQFHLPDGGICECYWIEVDTMRGQKTPSNWDEQVEFTAAEALRQFARIGSEFDIVAEGIAAFPDHLLPLLGSGEDLRRLARFVWYVEAPT
jgi:hypothetical protein